MWRLIWHRCALLTSCAFVSFCFQALIATPLIDVFFFFWSTYQLLLRTVLWKLYTLNFRGIVGFCAWHNFLFLPLQVQYMLESDSFDSVQELVRFYVGQRKPVSQSSGVHIYCPVSRTLPLRYLEATFALSNSKQGSAYSPSSQRGAYIKRRSVTMTDGLTTEKIIPHRWAEWSGSQVGV